MPVVIIVKFPSLRWLSLDLTNVQSTLVYVTVGAVRHQVIAWANVDPVLRRHEVWLGHNELKLIFYAYKTHSGKLMIAPVLVN